MQREQLAAKWIERVATYRGVDARVDAAALCEEFVRDLAALDDARAEESLTVAEAANDSGYSVQHIRRLINAGKVPASGSGRDLRVRRADLPRKPGRVARARRPVHLVGATAEQAVRERVGVS